MNFRMRTTRTWRFFRFSPDRRQTDRQKTFLPWATRIRRFTSFAALRVRHSHCLRTNFPKRKSLFWGKTGVRWATFWVVLLGLLTTTRRCSSKHPRRRGQRRRTSGRLWSLCVTKRRNKRVKLRPGRWLKLLPGEIKRARQPTWRGAFRKNAKSSVAAGANLRCCRALTAIARKWCTNLLSAAFHFLSKVWTCWVLQRFA